MMRKIKAALAGILAMTLAFGNLAYAGTTPKATTPKSIADEELSRKLEGESIVLAQNNNGVLPVSQDQKIAVFGNGQLNPATAPLISSGGAAGSYTSNFIDGLEELEIEPYEELKEYYAQRVGTSVNHGWDTAAEYP